MLGGHPASEFSGLEGLTAGSRRGALDLLLQANQSARLSEIEVPGNDSVRQLGTPREYGTAESDLFGINGTRLGAPATEAAAKTPAPSASSTAGSKGRDRGEEGKYEREKEGGLHCR